MSRVLDAIGSFIFVEDKPQPADVIMVVGGSAPESAETAASLWKQGYAPLILIGGGVSIKTGRFPGPSSKADVYSRSYASEYDFYLDVLTHNGVPESAVFGEDRSSFTRENALYARQAADSRGLAVKTALLVCQAFHARRSLMFYQSYFPETLFRVIPWPGFGITRDNWYTTGEGVSRVLGELQRCGEQFGAEDIERYRTE